MTSITPLEDPNIFQTIENEPNPMEKPTESIEKLIEKPIEKPSKIVTEGNEPIKKPNLFLSSEESDNFVHNFISESEKSLKNDILEEKSVSTLFMCSQHNHQISYFCTIHVDYLCDECKKDHLSHVRSLERYGMKELMNNLINLEEKFAKIKSFVIDHQKALKMIIENETNKSEDISLILRKIFCFLSKPFLKNGMDFRRKRSRSLKKISQMIKESKKTAEEIEIIPVNKPIVSKMKSIKEIIPKSRLISDKEDQSFIKLMLDPHLNKNEGLFLIFQASRDGFKASNFHEICDDKTKTFIIIKSNFGNIFGGYTNHPWKSYPKGQYIKDDDAFLYSLTYHTKHKQIKNNEFSLYLTKNYGPVFGKGYDLCVKDDCNKGFTNYCRLGNSYMGPAGMDTVDNYNYFGGSEYFAIEEYEVFHIKEII